MSTSLPERNLKFRPSLSFTQIKHILESLTHDDEISVSIRRVLVPMIAKIEIGAISPAYRVTEFYTQKLAAKTEAERYQNGDMTPDEEAEYEQKILGI